MSFSPGILGFDPGTASRCTQSEQDSEQLHEILDILVQFGRERDRMLNDARHLQNAIRYAADSFVTRDRFLLNRSDEIFERYPLRIVTPEQAADLVRRLAQRAEGRTDR